MASQDKLIIKYGKPLLSPLSILLLVAGVGTLVCLCYFSYLTLTWTGLRYNVVLNSDNIGIVSPSPEPSEVFKGLQPGDRIVALNDQPLAKLLAGKTQSDFELLVYPIQPGVKELSIAGGRLSLPLNPGTHVLLWSIRARTLTLDFSQRENGPPASLSFANSPAATILNPTQVRLNLESLSFNTERDVVTIILLLVALSICGMSLFFYISKPSQITGIYNLLNLVLGLELIGSSIDRSYLAELEKMSLVLAGPLIGVLFLHFMLLFPSQRRLGYRAKIVLGLVYPAVLALIAVRCFVVYAPLPEPPFAAELVVRKLNYLGVFLPVIAGIGLLIYKYFKSQGLERHKIQLAVLAFGLSAIIPLGAGIYYLIASLWQPVVYERFGIFFLPCMIVPPAFGYAVVKNDLLGLSLKVRRIVVHVILTILIFCSFVIVSLVLTAISPIWKELSHEPFLVALVLLGLIITLYQLRFMVQRLVDRAFKVDPLDYLKLNQYWNNYLVRASTLETIFERVVLELPQDYHYQQVALLVWYPSVLEIVSLDQPILVYANSSDEIKIAEVAIPDSLNTIEGRSYFTTGEAPLQLGNLTSFESHFLLPLRLGEEIYGLLLLGEKYTEYLPTTEELQHLSGLAGQIAVSLYTAGILATEKALRQLYEQFLNREETAREQERMKIPNLLHDDILQQLLAHKRELNRLHRDYNPQKLNESLREVDIMASQLRDLNAWLVPPSLQDNFSGELAEFYHRQQQLHPEIIFCFRLEGEQERLEKLLSVDLKACLFRLVEEATNNAINHASATNIWTVIQLDANSNLEVEIADNGVGLDPKVLDNFTTLLRQKHFGLSSFKRRVEQFQGEVKFHTAPAQGLKIVVSLPLPTISYPTFEELLHMKN